jgi:hypothetical protein
MTVGEMDLGSALFLLDPPHPICRDPNVRIRGDCEQHDSRLLHARNHGRIAENTLLRMICPLALFPVGEFGSESDQQQVHQGSDNRAAKHPADVRGQTARSPVWKYSVRYWPRPRLPLMNGT